MSGAWRAPGNIPSLDLNLPWKTILMGWYNKIMASDWLTPVPAFWDFVRILEKCKVQCIGLSARQRVGGTSRLPAAGNKGNLNPDKNYEILRPPQAGPRLIMMLMVIGLDDDQPNTLQNQYGVFKQRIQSQHMSQVVLGLLALHQDVLGWHLSKSAPQYLI